MASAVARRAVARREYMDDFISTVGTRRWETGLKKNEGEGVISFVSLSKSFFSVFK